MHVYKIRTMAHKNNQAGRVISASHFDLYVILYREECGRPEITFLSKGSEMKIGGGFSKIRISNSLDKIKCELGDAYGKTCYCKHIEGISDEETEEEVIQ